MSQVAHKVSVSPTLKDMIHRPMNSQTLHGKMFGQEVIRFSVVTKTDITSVLCRGTELWETCASMLTS